MEEKYIIYTISLQGKVMYVGQTNNFYRRKKQHLNKRGGSTSAIPINVDLSLISFNILAEADNEIEALQLEDKYILEYNTIENGWNERRSGMICRGREKEYKHNWYEEHWEECNAKRKKWKEDNPEQYKETHNTASLKWNQEHKDKCNAADKRWYQKHREKKLAYQRERYAKKKAEKLLLQA